MENLKSSLDLQELIRKRLNVRQEIQRIRRNPLAELLKAAYPKSELDNARAFYEETYYLYVRAMERALEQVSLMVRYHKGPGIVRSAGGKYGPGQKRIALKYGKLRPYLELDICSWVIFTKALFDRTIALTEQFFKGEKRPSFVSFHKHKTFLKKTPDAFPQHKLYRDYIVDETDWVDSPVKYIRDKFIVHSLSDGIYIKWFSVGDNLSLRVNKLNGNEIKGLDLNVWRLSYHVEEFLKWFGQYWLEYLKTDEMKSFWQRYHNAQKIGVARSDFFYILN